LSAATSRGADPVRIASRSAATARQQWRRKYVLGETTIGIGTPDSNRTEISPLSAYANAADGHRERRENRLLAGSIAVTGD
jgi:hypothetical protein